jgi:uroporphyrinogen-III decarboxylase
VVFRPDGYASGQGVLGDACCIMGNVPISLIASGTPDRVRAYCKHLIDYCGKGGSYIVTIGTQIGDGRFHQSVRRL